LRAVVHSRIMAKEQEVASAERLAAEGGIASDESAVAEPEIEINEGPAEEHEKEPNERSAAEGDSGESGCSIRMGEFSTSPRCGRKLHAAPEGVDENTVCLMHSKDPNKQSGPLCDTFWLEFERTLENAGEGEAHFERFVFPQLNVFIGLKFQIGRNFQAICQFTGATFTKDTYFWRATFTRDANFKGATFMQNAYFSDATFAQEASFEGATFAKDAIFFNMTFARDANFRKATFTLNAMFSKATFTLNATFSKATFKQNAYFGATFKQGADFNEASFATDATFILAAFSQNSNFRGTTFAQHANFTGATFTQDADFADANFTQVAIFAGATFVQMACFSDTKFYGTAYWYGSRFFDLAEFRRTKFELHVEGEPSAVFTLAKFSNPSGVVFDDVDLSRALFSSCDVSQVWFTSSVQWAKREGNRGLAVFDETIPLKQEYGRGLQRNGQLDYRAVAQVYQQLKKNYDSRLDYWTANEFHYGEMEMKRLAGPTAGPLLWLRRWWHPRLSFVAWYKYASDYGNSYGWPLFWLFVILLAAALLFPITGLELKQAISGDGANSASVTYSSEWDKNNSWMNNFWTEAKLIGKSGITAIDTATFQRTPEYTPVFPWGRVVAIFETLLTSSLFALFLLAIRRQFRR